MISKNIILTLLIVSFLANILLMYFIWKSNKKNQLTKIFSVNISCILICLTGLISQVLFSDKFNINPIYFDYFVYIGTCFLPISVLFTGKIFSNTKLEFQKKYLLLFILPITSLLILWTNDFHHLFYIYYSINLSDCIFGPYMMIHNIYSYTLLLFGIGYLLTYSIKNAGFFSKQSILIVLGISIPVIVNFLGTFKIMPMTIYMTPISFTLTMLLLSFAMFKFQFLGVAPIALQKIVDKISDSYVVLDENDNITDFNDTFVKTFKISNNKIRNKNIIDILIEYDTKSSNINTLQKELFKIKNVASLREVTKKSNSTISFELSFDKISKTFMIEISTISSKGNFLGNVILFKDITQHIKDMQQIKNNQEMLMERERLASLGQMIGGIAHNLKTPIMSIAGAAEGLNDLIKEYDLSIGNPQVTNNDHHDIAKDMSTWVDKIKNYTEYMSDVITAVKGQAVVLSDEQQVSFTVEELVKRVDILMRHELKNSLINLVTQNEVDPTIKLHGNVNSLVQVINNMISNSIQAYNGKTNQNIEFIITTKKNNVVFTIKDYADGLPKEVEEKLFKEMITTKGKNGTGLGLFMSYSNIRAHFNGNITFKTKKGEGTEFNIIIPMEK